MLKKIFYSFLSKGTIAVINFLILIFSARYLGVRTRGEISIFLINIALVQLFAEVYTGYSLVHFFSKFNHRKIFLFGILVTLLAATATGWILPQLSFSPHVSQFQYTLILLLVLLHSFFCVALLGMQRLRLYNLLALLQPLLLLVLLLSQLFYLKSFTFEAYFDSICYSFVFSLPVSSAFVLHHLQKNKSIHLFSLKPILGNGFYFQASVVMLMFINRYNYYWLDESARVGLYSTASALMESLLLIASAATPVFLARLSTNVIQSENIVRIIRICLLLVIAAYFLFLLIPESAIIWMIGSGFVGIREIMLWYGPSVIFQSACMLLGSYFTAKGLQKITVKAYAGPFLLTLLLSPLCIYWFGLIGAAVLSSVTFLLVFLQLYRQFCGQEKLNPLLPFRFFSVWKEIRYLMQDL